jgi:hypothetical protein
VFVFFLNSKMGVFQSKAEEENKEEEDQVPTPSTLNENCRIWTGINHPDFIFPELNGEYEEILSKQNYGIALSGGGCRALTSSIGTLRGLHQLGLLKTARYISTNSGSSWLNGPLSYSTKNLNEFLGEYLSPENCTQSNLKMSDPNSHAFFLSHGNNLQTFLRELKESLLHQDGNDHRGFWSQAIGYIFFQSYHLNSYDYLPVYNQGESQHHTQHYPPEKMSSYDPTHSPFPIINGCVVVQGNQISAPLEFTPLYYGIPGYFKYDDDRKKVHDEYPVGGYLIEPYGFTSRPSTEQCASIKELLETSISSSSHISSIVDSSSLMNGVTPPAVFMVDVPMPQHLISVSEQAGISSSAVAQVIAHSITPSQGKRLHMTVRPLWNPLSGEVHEMLLSDGLGGDNTAIHSLLRRKVHKICAMFATNCSILEPVNHRSSSESGFADIAALFGVMTCESKTTMDGVLPSDFNKYRQVFPSEDYDILFNGLKSKCLKGEPCTFLLHTRAVPNPLVGIPGDHPVDLLLIICAPSERWMNSLPETTSSRLRKKFHDPTQVSDEEDRSDEMEETKDGVLDHFEDIFEGIGENLHDVRAMLRQIFKRSDLRDFPYPISESMNYSPELVNLLTNLMTWEVLESRELFDEMLKEVDEYEMI